LNLLQLTLYQFYFQSLQKHVDISIHIVLHLLHFLLIHFHLVLLHLLTHLPHLLLVAAHSSHTQASAAAGADAAAAECRGK
jgi:hypothetical protein